MVIARNETHRGKKVKEQKQTVLKESLSGNQEKDQDSFTFMLIKPKNSSLIRPRPFLFFHNNR